MLVGVASLPPEYRHFTIETGKTAYTFATQCKYIVCERYMSHGLSPNLSPAAPFYDEFRSHERVLDCDSIVTIAI